MRDDLHLYIPEFIQNAFKCYYDEKESGLDFLHISKVLALYAQQANVFEAISRRRLPAIWIEEKVSSYECALLVCITRVFGFL